MSEMTSRIPQPKLIAHRWRTLSERLAGYPVARSVPGRTVPLGDACADGVRQMKLLGRSPMHSTSIASKYSLLVSITAKFDPLG